MAVTRAPSSSRRKRAATYRAAGVDVEGADAWLASMRDVIRSTRRPGLLPDRGQFAGLFRLASLRLRDPVLVSSTDGVGTKLKVAQLLGAHEGIGVDVVAMNTNDVLVYGAQPIFFLDYLAIGRLDRPLLSALLRGIAEGCRQSGCALLGGETAEMPGVYGPGVYDVAGFCVAAVERTKLIDGSRVRANDVVVGLASSGVHANGFSLIRRVFTNAELRRQGKALLAPTRIYVKPVLAAAARYELRALAHVTGGGLARRLPSLVAGKPGLRVRGFAARWPVPEIFERIQSAGRVSDEAMASTFNLGIGLALVVRKSDVDGVIRLLGRDGVAAWPIGVIERQRAPSRLVRA